MRVMGGWLGQWSGGWLGPGAPGIPSGYLVGHASATVAADGVLSALVAAAGSAALQLDAAGNLQPAPSASMSGAVYIRISAALQLQLNPRVLVEVGQSRVWSIAAECRLLDSPAESRWIGTGVELRVMVAPAESRALATVPQSRYIEGEN